MNWGMDLVLGGMLQGNSIILTAVGRDLLQDILVQRGTYLGLEGMKKTDVEQIGKPFVLKFWKKSRM